MTNITLTAFWDLLNKHDWFYDFSDCGQTWRRGSEAHDKLKQHAQQGPEFQKLYDAFKQHHFNEESGFSSRGPQVDKPQRPEGVSA